MSSSGTHDDLQPSFLASGDKYGSTIDSGDGPNNDVESQANGRNSKKSLSEGEIAAILSTAFAYGCVMTTLFLITLPVECERIHYKHSGVPKSVALGVFVAIAGVTQLVSPFSGMLSDTYRPPTDDIGQRLPYLVFGSFCTVGGLLGQMLASDRSLWIRYSFAFFALMIGLNVIYSMMIALIPDQIPEPQIGRANGILALLLVSGSLFGFSLFHSVLGESVPNMYGLYICIVIFTSILTCSYAQDGDVALARLHRRRNNLPVASTRHPILSPGLILRTTLYDPLRRMDWQTLCRSYTIDVSKYHDFFVCTVSRTFYYMGISVQTFFMYYLHDIIKIKQDPESAVAVLAILGQLAGAFTCYPIGLASDRLMGGRRTPFVYTACTILALATLGLLLCSTLKHVTVVCLILGSANGMYLTMETSMAVDTLPNDDDNNEDGSGNAQLLGIWGVAGFVGSALGPLIGGPLLYAVGHESTGEDGVEEEYSIAGYAVVIALSTVYFCCSAFSLLFIRMHRL